MMCVRCDVRPDASLRARAPCPCVRAVRPPARRCSRRDAFELTIEGNRIGVRGAVALGAALRHDAVLRVLDLRGNGIGTDGAAAMAGALRTNVALQVLQVVPPPLGRVVVVAM